MENHSKIISHHPPPGSSISSYNSLQNQSQHRMHPEIVHFRPTIDDFSKKLCKLLYYIETKFKHDSKRQKDLIRIHELTDQFQRKKIEPMEFLKTLRNEFGEEFKEGLSEIEVCNDNATNSLNFDPGAHGNIHYNRNNGSSSNFQPSNMSQLSKLTKKRIHPDFPEDPRLSQLDSLKSLKRNESNSAFTEYSNNNPEQPPSIDNPNDALKKNKRTKRTKRVRDKTKTIIPSFSDSYKTPVLPSALTENKKMQKYAYFELPNKIIPDQKLEDLIKEKMKLYSLEEHDKNCLNIINSIVQDKMKNIIEALIVNCRNRNANNYLNPRTLEKENSTQSLNFYNKFSDTEGKGRKVGELEIIFTSNDKHSLSRVQDYIQQKENDKRAIDLERLKKEEEKNSNSRKRDKKTDPRLATLKSKMDKQRENEEIKQQQENTLSTFEHFLGSQPKMKSVISDNAALSVDSSSVKRQMTKTEGKSGNAKSQKELNLNIYSSSNVTKCLHDENSKRRIGLKDLIYYLQRDPYYSRSKFLSYAYHKLNEL